MTGPVPTERADEASLLAGLAAALRPGPALAPVTAVDSASFREGRTVGVGAVRTASAGEPGSVDPVSSLLAGGTAGAVLSGFATSRFAAEADRAPVCVTALVVFGLVLTTAEVAFTIRPTGRVATTRAAWLDSASCGSVAAGAGAGFRTALAVARCGFAASFNSADG